MNKEQSKLPELLCPAGNPLSLEAAIQGGADAVYIGGTSFNARINADNFTDDSMKDCITLAHKYGVAVYQTLNTEIYDREIKDFLRSAAKSAEYGIDGFIVADIGAAAILKKYLPEIPLHASTQLSVHNSDGAKLLEKLGFVRVVPARELSRENIKSLVDYTDLEIEIFVHGALCVSHSGQCLFSSLVGGRSGNRGECAQPCRLPYSTGTDTCTGTGAKSYPLSLKDMSLATHIREILNLGVDSLKIEGRMKSPDYVMLVSSVYRKLLDERRDATKDEMSAMAEMFSRGGFTDGYFIGEVNKKMLGVRAESDKKASKQACEGDNRFTGLTKKIPICMKAVLKTDKTSVLTVSGRDGKKVTVYGDRVQAAINAPLDNENIVRNLSKLGGSSYFAQQIDVCADENIMMPLSSLNALRRAGIESFDRLISESSLQKRRNKADIPVFLPDKPKAKKTDIKTARFLFGTQITAAVAEYFDKIYLPLKGFEEFFHEADANLKEKLGFFMPPVVFDGEQDKISHKVLSCIRAGANSIILSNISQIKTVGDLICKAERRDSVELVTDFRFNVTNAQSICELERLGIDRIILSAELTLPKIRDLCGNVENIVYGRVPLMTLEKCIIKDLYGCERCKQNTPGHITAVCDRKNVNFPVIRDISDLSHRNIIYNSLPISMSDKMQELSVCGVKNMHFMFTVETGRQVDSVINSYIDGSPIPNSRRI